MKSRQVNIIENDETLNQVIEIVKTSNNIFLFI